MAAGMIVLSGLMGNSSNKDLLETALVHYFENVLVVRSARDMPDGISEEQPDELVQPEREAARSSAAARARGAMRDDLFMQKKDGAQKENNVSAENEKRVNRPELVRKEERRLQRPGGNPGIDKYISSRQESSPQRKSS